MKDRRTDGKTEAFTTFLSLFFLSMGIMIVKILPEVSSSLSLNF